jgi:uncharacterized protein with FMN-binding domain
MKTNARKIIVSALVIVIFAAYIYQQRHDSQSRTIASSSSSTSPTAPSSVDTSSSADDQTAKQSPGNTSSAYKDGQYTGTSEDAFYGFIQVKATISGGKISDIEFLKYPDDQPNSIQINQQAMPILKQEAIKAQSSKVDIISGATDTAYAFMESLKSALNQAKT